MGLRGPAPKPTAVRIFEGNRSRRPLPQNEPQYRHAVPTPPWPLSKDARKLWDALVEEMGASGVLRKVDGPALAQLCEDQAMLNDLRAGLHLWKDRMIAQVKAEGGDGGASSAELARLALVKITQSTQGRRTLASIRELSSQIIVQRREFGLTPASNSRVNAIGGTTEDPLEAALGAAPLADSESVQ